MAQNATVRTLILRAYGSDDDPATPPLFEDYALVGGPSWTGSEAFDIVRRVSGFGIASPTKAVLFTVPNREDRYKSQNLIDTPLSRLGDAVSAQAHEGLVRMNLGIPARAWLIAPLAVLCLALCRYLGREHERRRASTGFETKQTAGASAR